MTYNKHFETLDDVHQREHQINYSKETNDDGLVFKEESVKFILGYPSIRIDYEDETFTNFLLPTMINDMLTKEIVAARYTSKNHNNRVMYEIESDAWIDVLGTHLGEREYELACQVVPHLVKTPLEVLKASAGRPYDQKLFEKQMTQINQ